jgi:hypothetical protein
VALQRRRQRGPPYRGVDDSLAYASYLWELFGVRAWHEGDLSSIDADVLDSLVLQAKRVHTERNKKEPR